MQWWFVFFNLRCNFGISVSKARNEVRLIFWLYYTLRNDQLIGPFITQIVTQAASPYGLLNEILNYFVGNTSFPLKNFLFKL